MADLPELPRCAYSLHIHAAAHIQDFYTADQMREYAITALRTALEAAPAAPKVEPCKPLCELCVKRGYNFCANAAETTLLPQAAPAAREPQSSFEAEAALVAQRKAFMGSR